MREMKLQYSINLVSNIGSIASRDAQRMLIANKAMQDAVDKTGAQVGRLDGAFARWGANTATERQIGYMQRLATGIDQARGKMRSLAEMSASLAQKAPAAMAGVAAGFYAAKAAIDKPMDYDMRLRAATATAFAGQGVEALRGGRGDVNKLVEAATRQAPGSTRDATLMAFEKLIGSGSFSLDESKQLLPSIMRTSVASRSEPTDLVAAAEKMKVSLGITAQQMPMALSKIMRAGQEGGFEIKDSAKWMGPLLPYMKGYSGMQGVETLVTMLQQTRSTAGTNDEAANNLRNFLQKMGSDSTRKDFKKQGIDLDAEMASGAVAGATPVDTYMGLLERVMAKQDPQGKARAAMRAADKSLSAEEQKARYDAVADIYKGAGISKIINDLQEMGGYSGLAGTKAYGKKVLGAVRGETGGAVDTGFTFMTEGTGAKTAALGAERDIAVSNVFNSKSGPLNALLDKATDLAREFPTVTTAAVGAAGALGVLAASAGVFSLLVLRGAGGKGVPGVPVGGPLPGGGAAGGLVSAGANGRLAVSTVGTAAAAGGALGPFARMLGPAGMLLSLVGTDFGAVDASAAGARDEASAGILGSIGQRRAGAAGRGQGYNDPRLLTLTRPGIPEQALALGQATEIKMGAGVLDVKVTVSDERVTATTGVPVPMPLLKINAGSTNPGGF